MSNNNNNASMPNQLAVNLTVSFAVVKPAALLARQVAPTTANLKSYLAYNINHVYFYLHRQIQYYINSIYILGNQLAAFVKVVKLCNKAQQLTSLRLETNDKLLQATYTLASSVA